MKTMLSIQVKELFGCTVQELSNACWEVITKSNDYFGEQKGEVVSIKEINYNDPMYRNTWGVVQYERTMVIGYRMFNRDGSPCGTEVFWSSLRGGILCHGTDAYIPFRTSIKHTPVMLVKFYIGTSENRKTAHVAFGGTNPTLEEKNDLINLIMKKRGIRYWDMEHFPTQTKYVLYGQRERFLSCKRFLKNLVKGCYDARKEETKYVTKIEYLGKCGSKFTTITGREEPLAIYKVVYSDGTKEYKKQFIFQVNRL